MEGEMPRQARIGLSALIYHVITRGNNRSWVFEDREDFEKYLAILSRYKAKGGFLLYHWALMNNHVHLLLETTENSSLTKIMQGINLSYTLWFNRKYRRVGHLWQDRFRSYPVERDEYLLECGRYIERNPLRAGLVQCPGEYLWSSFKVHAEGRVDGITDSHDTLKEQFSAGGKETYRAFVNGHREREEQEMREKMRGGIIGSQTFQTGIRADLQAARRPKKGRPRKNDR
jgi:putative transposase